MADPFPSDPLVDLWAKFTYAGPYERDYQTLLAEKNSGEYADYLEDFDHWVWLTTLCIFEGRGSNPGLTELCNSLIFHLTRVVEDGNRSVIDNWYYRLSHLQPHYLGLYVPSLQPLADICLALRQSRAISSDPEMAKAFFKASTSSLQEKWRSGATRLVEKLLPNLCDGDRILVIGHSSVVKHALDQALANGVKLDLFLYCPGPDRPGGRAPSTCECTCPFVGQAKPLLHEKDMVKALGRKEINKVICAACAYTADREAIWITKGGGKIAAEASKNGAVFLPLAGDYKQLERDPEDMILDRTSNVVDLLDAKQHKVVTTCLA